MTRANSSVTRQKRHKKIIQAGKGYRGRNNCYRLVKSRVEKAWQYAYRDRKAFKRDIKSIWIVRINAALRSMNLTYSKFMNLFNKSDLTIDKKHLAHLAYGNSEAFKQIVNKVVHA